MKSAHRNSVQSLTRLLTAIRGSGILVVATLTRRASGTLFRGPFSFAGSLLVGGMSELVKQRRQALFEKPAKLHASRLVQLQLDLVLRGSKLRESDSLFIADGRCSRHGLRRLPQGLARMRKHEIETRGTLKTAKLFAGRCLQRQLGLSRVGDDLFQRLPAIPSNSSGRPDRLNQRRRYSFDDR